MKCGSSQTEKAKDIALLFGPNRLGLKLFKSHTSELKNERFVINLVECIARAVSNHKPIREAVMPEVRDF
jgi:hypothetical protein